jgi:pimeloyl-ACP methyl ester carboxylesterase
LSLALGVAAAAALAPQFAAAQQFPTKQVRIISPFPVGGGPDGVARRLKKTNPRLSDDKAQWLARHWAAERVDGQWAILGEPAHKVSNAHIYRVEEVQALYAQLTMPVLAVEASDDSLTGWWRGKYTLDEYHERLKAVPNVEVAVVQDAGHMMHHDQPEVLAALIERFIA